MNKSNNVAYCGLYCGDCIKEKRYKKVIIMGRSLGAAIALHVARNKIIDRIILTTPFDSVKNVGQRKFPLFPIGILLKHTFDSLTNAKLINVPILLFLAEEDKYVPKENSQKLINNFNKINMLKEIKGSNHRNIKSFDEYWNTIKIFLSKDP